MSRCGRPGASAILVGRSRPIPSGIMRPNPCQIPGIPARCAAVAAPGRPHSCTTRSGCNRAQLWFEILGVNLVERIRRTKRPQSVRGQRRVHLVAGREMHLVSGLSYRDREGDQRVRVTDRRKAGEEHAHADERTPTRPRDSRVACQSPPACGRPSPTSLMSMHQAASILIE